MCNHNCEKCINDSSENEADSTKKNVDKIKWWFNHSRKQWTNLYKQLSTDVDESTQISILEEMGKNCAKSLGWADNFIDNPEGFFEFMNERAGENFQYDKEEGKILITTKDRDCDCYMIDSSTMPSVYCNCSKGWQMHTYETILKKKVKVEVLESVLMGSKKCVFEVTVLED